MSFANKGMAMIRCLSVFYLLAAAALIFFGYYYYRYSPANEAELTNRGFRILNKLSDNVVSKQYAIHEVLGNIVNAQLYENRSCDQAAESSEKRNMNKAITVANIEQAGIRLMLPTK